MSVNSKRLLQDMLSEFGCTVINRANEKMKVDFFYNEDMYEKFLSGLDCKQGMAIFDMDQELDFNIIPDGKLVIVQKDGVGIAKYRYATISKATIAFKEMKEGKRVNASLTFRIRENKFDDLLNFIDTKGNSLDFASIEQVKEYLKHQYGAYKFIDGVSSLTDERIKTYTVIDVETPSSSNDSICSIGLVHVNDDTVISEEYYLVNPECSFDRINMDIHKITKAMVIDKPIFPEIWEKISKYFTNGIVVAHNAAFDLNVICKTLNNYKINIPDFYYICTLELAGYIPNIENCKLNTICDSLNIKLDYHHNSLCDAIACQKIIAYIKSNYPITAGDVRQYRFNDNYIKKADKPTLVKSLNSLYGIVTGIVADRFINDMELQRIETWINEYERFSDSYPYILINPKIQNMILDKIITAKEKEKLINLVGKYMPENTFSDATLSMQVLMGILEGITCDKMINVLELESLQQWMNDNMHLKGNYPFDTIFTTINKVFEDGIVTTDESNELVELFNNFLNPTEKKANFCLELSGKKICLTGNFVNGTKDDIGELLVNRGGEISSGVTKKTNIVIVGGEGSKEWSYSNFGTKVKKAMELKSKGFDIEIISEEEFFNFIGMNETA